MSKPITSDTRWGKLNLLKKMRAKQQDEELTLSERRLHDQIGLPSGYGGTTLTLDELVARGWQSTEHLPGSIGKEEVLKFRAVNGLPLFHPDDAGNVVDGVRGFPVSGDKIQLMRRDQWSFGGRHICALSEEYDENSDEDLLWFGVKPLKVDHVNC